MTSDALHGKPPPQTAAERKQLERRRAKQGIRIFRVPLKKHEAAERLVRLGVLSDLDSDDDRSIATAVAVAVMRLPLDPE